MENNENRVTKYFSLPPLRITELKERLKEADRIWLKDKPNVCVPSFLFGIEIEVERVQQAQHYLEQLHYWRVTTDGSLRMGGLELVSLPIRMEQVEAALNELNAVLPKERDFSERTSTHVHMNVRDLTISQITNLTLLYSIVERVLFKWVGHNRDKNPFCIPLLDSNYTRLLTLFLEDPGRYTPSWNKYTALNLHPICEKGTVEFRHMYGTSDTYILLTWINFLGKLKEKAKKWTTKNIIDRIKPLNTTSAYGLFLEDVFEEYAYNFTGYPYQELMEHAVTLIKLHTDTKKLTERPKEVINRGGQLAFERMRAFAGNLDAGLVTTLAAPRPVHPEELVLNTIANRRG